MAYLRFRSPESPPPHPTAADNEPDINPRLTAPLRDPPQSVPVEKGRVVTSKNAPCPVDFRTELCVILFHHEDDKATPPSITSTSTTAAARESVNVVTTVPTREGDPGVRD
ncbi:hypothetical protein TNCV_3336881 [Trichonephila clavipes]|nr:hypothetical protein TNCV_3336881 [Trichonephila clavipes]